MKSIKNKIMVIRVKYFWNFEKQNGIMVMQINFVKQNLNNY